MKLLVGTLIVFLVLYSCTKTGVPSPSGNGGTVVVNDILKFPVTKGNYWKYQRIDSTLSVFPNRDSIITSDVSEELITVVGDTLIPSIHPVTKLSVLLINNLTKNKSDTNFILYTKDTFALYGHVLYQVGSIYGGPSVSIPDLAIDNGWGKFVRVILPVTNSPFNIDSMRRFYYFSFDTVYSRIDTTLTVSGSLFPGSVYVNYLRWNISFAASGAGGYTYNYLAFFKPAVGILYVRQTPIVSQGGAYNNIHFQRWFTRRLVNYKVL